MGKDPLFESAWTRTLRDFHNAFYSYRWCSFALGLVAIVWEGYMIVVPLYIVPSDSAGLAIRWIQAGTFVGGMVIFLIIVFLVCGLFTPYKQRNEARALLKSRKTIPLPNRNKLIEAIAEIKTATIKYIHLLDTIHYSTSVKVNQARERYENAREQLESQQLIAGKEYESALVWLFAFTTLQITLSDIPVRF